MIKDLNDKTFKYYIYTKHYNTTLNFIKGLRPEKTFNITFNKKPKISKEHLVQKDKKRV